MEFSLFRFALLVHAAATLYMTGVIWMVQLAHYPLMALVGAEELPAWQAENLRRTTWVVGLPMLVEAATTVALLTVADARVLGVLPWLGALVLAAIWVSTAVLQVPAHDALARTFNADTVGRLVASNWLRTVLWTTRSALVLYMVHRAWGTA